MRNILLVGTLLLVACGPAMQVGPDEPITLLVVPSAVTPGGSVELVLRNESESEIGYNLCASGLERRTEASWEAIPSDRVCTMELRALPVGDEARYGLELSADLQPGQYRAVANVEMMEAGQMAPVVSAPFEVGP